MKRQNEQQTRHNYGIDLGIILLGIWINYEEPPSSSKGKKYWKNSHMSRSGGSEKFPLDIKSEHHCYRQENDFQ